VQVKGALDRWINGCVTNASHEHVKEDAYRHVPRDNRAGRGDGGALDRELLLVMKEEGTLTVLVLSFRSWLRRIRVPARCGTP
jgi:hypothetical protein